MSGMDHIDVTVGTEIQRDHPSPSRPYEPDWAPLWVWDANDNSRWVSKGDDVHDNGPWLLEATPDTIAREPRLEISLRQLGMSRGICPNRVQAMALRKVIDAWLEALALTSPSGGGA